MYTIVLTRSLNHTGYVIEYDLEKMTIEQKSNLYKVAYLSKSDLQQIDNHIPRLPIYNLIQKDSEWSYELEWRMIKMRGSLEMEDLSSCVSAVHLGMNFPNQMRSFISAKYRPRICQW